MQLKQFKFLVQASIVIFVLTLYAAQFAHSQRPNTTRAKVQETVRALNSPDAKKRAAALFELREIKTLAKQAVPRILALLKDPSMEVRFNAMYALAAVAPDDARTIPALIPMLKDQDPDIRFNATNVFVELGKRALPAAAALIAALDDPVSDVHIGAAWALGELGEAAKPAVPKIISRLKSSDSDTCLSAMHALGFLSKQAPEAVPELIEVLKNDADPACRADAAYTLGHFYSKTAAAAVPSLVDALPHPEIHRSAIYALRMIGTTDETLLPKILESFDPNDCNNSYEFVQVIRGYGKKAVSALPKVVKVFDSRCTTAQLWAVKMLGETGGELHSTLAALLPQLTISQTETSDGDTNPGLVEVEAMRSLLKILSVQKPLDAETIKILRPWKTRLIEFLNSSLIEGFSESELAQLKQLIKSI